MSIRDIEQEIVDEFSIFSDWMEKYEYIIELGKKLPTLDDAFKTEVNLVKGCQSRVWLHTELQHDGKVIFTADSDAVITKGIIALLIRVLSGHKPADIISADLSFIDRIGLREHLSLTRSNGLVSMIKQMKLTALAFTSKKIKGD